LSIYGNASETSEIQFIFRAVGGCGHCKYRPTAKKQNVEMFKYSLENSWISRQN